MEHCQKAKQNEKAKQSKKILILTSEMEKKSVYLRADINKKEQMPIN
jgi:hypothetical protein